MTVTDADDVPRTFHLLDSGGGSGDAPPGILLCVHGNPTWSYLWRRLVAAPPLGWRVVAPDQLGMGYSERLDAPRTLAQRVDDLSRLTDALGLTGPGQKAPIVTVAHDWGGIISLGWADRHRAQLRGVVLTNTAVHQPAASAGPILIRAAVVPGLREMGVVRTPLFVATTTALSRPRLPGDIRRAYAAPYVGAPQRAAVGEFVADIPFAAGHPSHTALDSIAQSVRTLRVPALLLWGPRDPVFGELHLRDLQERLPQAALHRYEGAGHLLPEDAPQYVEAVGQWVSLLGEEVNAANDDPIPTLSPAPDPARSVLTALRARAADQQPAVVEVGGASISWAQLAGRVRDTAAGLAAAGVRPGDRVALLVQPSIELTVALYSVWAAGAAIVVADKGLGLRGLGRALRGARIDHLIAGTEGLLAAGPLRLPGTRIAIDDVPAVVRRATGVRHTLPDIAGRGAGLPDVQGPSPDRLAAVVFTSGATGPAKGVRYRHRQLLAQLALITDTYRLTAADRMVAAFAPFALYGPALGIASAVPSTDVTQPGTLTAGALAQAATAVAATVVFASPAALRNVLATAAELSVGQRAALAPVRLLMSAGAPVPAELLRELAALLPAASLHTPYGMTEALPVTDISLDGIEAAREGDGVCVGSPLPGVQLRIQPFGVADASKPELTDQADVSGEIWVRAASLMDGYDALWQTDQIDAAHPGWHFTGDVGALDAQGRLWVQGRAVHVITTPDGPVTPVGVEQRAAAALGLGSAAGALGVAAVGVGPSGTQQLVVVITGSGGPTAGMDVTDRVRVAAGHPVAAVLVRSELPVDIRHNSKIDRTEVARWAEHVLAGG